MTAGITRPLDELEKIEELYIFTCHKLLVNAIAFRTSESKDLFNLTVSS